MEKNKNHKTLTEQEILAATQQLWLTYFNNTLYVKGLITQEQRDRMHIRIKNRTSTAVRILR